MKVCVPMIYHHSGAPHLCCNCPWQRLRGSQDFMSVWVAAERDSHLSGTLQTVTFCAIYSFALKVWSSYVEFNNVCASKGNDWFEEQCFQLKLFKSMILLSETNLQILKSFLHCGKCRDWSTLKHWDCKGRCWKQNCDDSCRGDLPIWHFDCCNRRHSEPCFSFTPVNSVWI